MLRSFCAMTYNVQFHMAVHTTFNLVDYKYEKHDVRHPLMLQAAPISTTGLR